MTTQQVVGAFATVAIGLAAVACAPGTGEGREATARTDESPSPVSVTGSGPFLLDIETGEQTPLPENLEGGKSYVASPDGTKLAFNTCCSGADRLTIANIDGTDARALPSPDGINYYGPRWSPDGTKLVYQQRNGGGDTALTGDVGNLIVHDLATGAKKQITDLELTRAWWWFLAPSFSPGGRDVLFHLPRSKSQRTKWDTWSVPVTGGEPTLVLRNATFPLLGIDLPNDVGSAYVSPWPDDFAGQSIVTARLLDPPKLSDLHRPLVEANISISWPTLSPSRNKIAYQDGGSIYVFTFASDAGLGFGESAKVADGDTAEWLDDQTLIVSP